MALESMKMANGEISYRQAKNESRKAAKLAAWRSAAKMKG